MIRSATLALACALVGAPLAAQSPGQPAAATGEAAPALRSDVGPRERMLMHVASYVFENMGERLEPKKTFRLVLVAKQQAMADNCEGFEVDPERKKAVLEDVLSGILAAAPEGQVNPSYDVAIALYSVMLGGETAVAGYDMDAYCAEAAQMRADFADGEGESVRIWKDPR